LQSEIKTPPFTAAARLEAGALLRRLQDGESLGMPHSRPMPSLGPRRHELRVRDEDRNWRIIYRLDSDAIAIADVFARTTRQTPKTINNDCQRRLRAYDEAARDETKRSENKGE
jgi:phage-related protein